jgi:hypothetical protein
MQQQRPGRDAERRLLVEITRIADQLRGLRARDAMANDAQIKTLTATLRGKWDELRATRAGPPATADREPRRRGYYD